MNKTALAAIRRHLGDVTPEEYDEYLVEEAQIIETLIERCDLKLAELESECRTFVDTVRSYYSYGVSLLAIATGKKLHSDASESEKRSIYFAAWMAEWISACSFIVNDICDGNERRAGQPTLPVQLGPNKALCLSISISNIVEDLATEIFAGKPFLSQFLTICRNNVKILSLAMLVDNSCEKYSRRRDTKWYGVREYCSSNAPGFFLPAELLFCVASVSMESEAGKASLQLANFVGSFLRSMDDVCDMELDTKAGRLNWAFWPAWRKANNEQRRILLEYTDTGKQASGVVLKLYSDLNVEKQFEILTTQTLQGLENLLEVSPEEIPKKTWASMLNFYLKVYSGAAGSIFQEQL